jgi:hypothetical protein
MVDFRWKEGVKEVSRLWYCDSLVSGERVVASGAARSERKSGRRRKAVSYQIGLCTWLGPVQSLNFACGVYASWGFLPFNVRYIQTAAQFIAGASEGEEDNRIA